jgi:hypothetical protein
MLELFLLAIAVVLVCLSTVEVERDTDDVEFNTPEELLDEYPIEELLGGSSKIAQQTVESASGAILSPLGHEVEELTEAVG